LELEISLVIKDVLCYLVLYNGRNSVLRVAFRQNSLFLSFSTNGIALDSVVLLHLARIYKNLSKIQTRVERPDENGFEPLKRTSNAFGGMIFYLL
jgi:hypothetical protein